MPRRAKPIGPSPLLVQTGNLVGLAPEKIEACPQVDLCASTIRDLVRSIGGHTGRNRMTLKRTPVQSYRAVCQDVLKQSAVPDDDKRKISRWLASLTLGVRYVTKSQLTQLIEALFRHFEKIIDQESESLTGSSASDELQRIMIVRLFLSLGKLDQHVQDLLPNYRETTGEPVQLTAIKP